LMWDRSTKLSQRENVEGIQYKRVRIKAGYEEARSSLRLLEVYINMGRAMIREAFDVVHCVHLALLPLAVVLGKLKNRRIVYDVGEFYTVGFFARLPRFIRCFETAALKFEDLLVKMVDGVICVPSISSLYADRYRRHNKNVQVIHNVPDTKNSAWSKEDVVALKQQYCDRKIVIFSGRINERNGAYRAIDAFDKVVKKFPEALLLFLGDTRKDQMSLEKKVENLELGSHVKFVGYVPYKKLQCFLEMADVGVSLVQPADGNPYSLMTKGNSRKIGEYMRAGLPIVASDYREVNQLVREERCGILVNSKNSEEIAEAICSLFSDNNIAGRMGKAGQKAVKEKYNWELEKRHLEAFYCRIWK